MIILLACMLCFLLISLIIVRVFAGNSLTLKGTLAMVTYSGLPIPGWYKDFVLNVDRSYVGLPELSLDPDDRPDMLSLYEQTVYGKTPSDGFETAFEVISQAEAFNGKAEQQTVRITVFNGHDSFSADMLVLFPKDADNHGFFIGETFSPNSEALKNTEWPYEFILDNGYGVATMCYRDWAEDNAATFRGGVLRLFDDSSLSAYSAWAFGISRGTDYLLTLPNVDANRIASAGHSRLARVSLWASACDGRIALATGSCGGGLLRSPVMSRITSSGSSNHWFTPAYLDYENRDSELPVDMHTLYALTAGRHLFISIGENDLASDPVSMFDALQLAKTVWRDGYKTEVIPDCSYFDLPPDTPVMSEGVGVIIHSGGHEMNLTDWKAYLAYMDEYVS